MSDDPKDIIEKHDDTETSFVATEEDLKTIISSTTTPKQREVQLEPKINRGEFKKTEVTFKPVEFAEQPAVDVPQGENELSTDYQYVRTNLYSITERSIEALNNLVQIADQSQHPRAYEVVALLVNTIAGAQKDLMTIHREKAKIEGTVNKNKPEIVNNNLFVGNTAQLDEIIKNMTKKHNDTEEE